MRVYGFIYNDMTEESSWATISLHKTWEGANKALIAHKEEEYQSFLRYKERCLEHDPEFFKDNPPIFGRFKDWDIQEREVLD